MGSRAVVIACRDAGVARARFGVVTGESGTIVTRTGRRFFADANIEKDLLQCLNRALDESGFWAEHKTDWVLFDCELMPWSVKAQELIRDQYAAVGAAARAALAESTSAVQAAAARGVGVDELVPRMQERVKLVAQYAQAYRRYCWPVRSLDDLKLAPFHLLATEGVVRTDKDHDSHMQAIAGLRRGSEAAASHGLQGGCV